MGRLEGYIALDALHFMWAPFKKISVAAMSNPNYLKGRRFEYQVAKEFREVYKCDVMRTAGSHGKADLIIIDKRGFVTLCQCKVVSDLASLERLRRNFMENPPFGHRSNATYKQLLSVKVVGESDFTNIYV